MAEKKRNIKHVVGETIGSPGGWAKTSALATAVMMVSFPLIMDNGVNAPDATGTDMSASVIAEHETDFTALQEMRADIDVLEAKAAISGSTAELSTLKEEFADKALNTYLDLYLDGASQDGAAISEEKFKELRDEFSSTIVNPEVIGFNTHIAPGMLDEVLGQTTLQTDTETDRFQTAKQIDNALAQANDDAGDPFLYGALASFASILLLLFGSIKAEQWRLYEPKYKSAQSKPKKPGKYGQH